MNTNYIPINDDILAKYVLHEADDAERTQVENWLNADPANRKQYEHLKLIIEKSMIEAQAHVNEYEALDRLHERIRSKGTKKSTYRFSYNPWMGVAASVLLVCFLSFIIYSQYWGNPEMLRVQSTGSVLTAELPDGSTVILNKNSTLTYPERFSGNKRDVTLSGEAFFNVKPDKSKPFTISAGDVAVKVLGTSFNVRNRGQETTVIVKTGIVSVSRQQESIRLTAGEKAMVSPGSKITKDTNKGELYNYYYSRELICNRTPLHELVEILNEKFSADITIADSSLQDLQITTTFRDESLNEILSVISETFKIRVDHEGEKIFLKKI